jgi:hypothetical protein
LFAHSDTKPLTAFDINYNDTMAIAGTEFSTSTQSADLAFYDTRNTALLHNFNESHGDDVTEVCIYLWLKRILVLIIFFLTRFNAIHHFQHNSSHALPMD